MGDVKRNSRSPSYNSPGLKLDVGIGRRQDSRSRSRSLTYRMESRPNDRYIKYSSSRSRSRERKSYKRTKYDGPRRASHSRSRSPGYRRSRSKSRSYSRSRYSRDNDNVIAKGSRSPMSNRKRHVGNRDYPKPSRCLGVFGLSSNTTETQIYDIFSKFGRVDRVVPIIDAKTKCGKGFCFVYFSSMEDAKQAREQCTGMTINGRIMRVDFSITEREHTPTPGIYMGRPTHLRRWESSRRRQHSHRDNHRRSRTPHYRRRSRYNRSRSRSFSPRRY